MSPREFTRGYQYSTTSDSVFMPVSQLVIQLQNPILQSVSKTTLWTNSLQSKSPVGRIRNGDFTQVVYHGRWTTVRNKGSRVEQS